MDRSSITPRTRPWRQRQIRRSRSALHEYDEVLSLDHIRERLGDKWLQCQDDIYKVAAKIIERHKHGPISIRRDKEYFCLKFRCSSREEARRRILEIAAALDKAIFGNLQAFASRTNNSGGLSLEQAGRRSSGWGLGQLFKRFTNWLIKRDGSEPTPANPARGVGNTVMPAGVAVTATAARGSISPIERQPSRAGPSTTAVGRIIPEPHSTVVTGVPYGVVAGPRQQGVSAPLHPSANNFHDDVDGDQISPDEITGIEALLTLEGARLASEKETLTRAAQFPPSDLQFIHRPIWSIKANLLGLSTCFPASIRNGTELCVGYRLLPNKYEQENVSFLDELVLRHVVAQCRGFEAAGRRPLIIVPVHYENLSDPDRLTRYTQICEEIPRAARRFLSFELWGLSEAYGHHQVVSILSILRRYSGLQFGNLSCGQANLTFWKTAGLHGIGVNVDEWAHQYASEKELIEGLERFRLCAYRTGLRSYARGIPNRSIALACVAAGYDFLDGAVIQRSVEPATISRFALDDLYGLSLA